MSNSDRSAKARLGQQELHGTFSFLLQFWLILLLILLSFVLVNGVSAQVMALRAEVPHMALPALE